VFLQSLGGLTVWVFKSFGFGTQKQKQKNKPRGSSKTKTECIVFKIIN